MLELEVLGRSLVAGSSQVLSCAAGGYFFGTFPSGKRVQAVIHKGGAWPLFKAPMLELKALWKGEVSPFGCAYNCAIGDTVTAGKLFRAPSASCQIQPPMLWGHPSYPCLHSHHLASCIIMSDKAPMLA